MGYIYMYIYMGYMYIYTYIYIGYVPYIRGIAPTVPPPIFRSGCIIVGQRNWWNCCCAPKLSVLA